MNIFLNDFTIYSDLESYLMKLKLCFRNVENIESRFIVSKEGKIPNPKKVHAIMNMLVPTNPKYIQVFNGMAQFYICLIKILAFIMAPITKLMRKTEPFNWITKCQKTWDFIYF